MGFQSISLEMTCVAHPLSLSGLFIGIWTALQTDKFKDFLSTPVEIFTVTLPLSLYGQVIWYRN